MAKRILKSYTLSIPLFSMPTQTPKPVTVEAKLDQILFHLERMDKRDRLRMIGGFFRSFLAIIPIVLLLWSSWYFIAHGTDLMKLIADQAAKSAAAYTKNQSSGMFDQFMKQYSVPKK